MLYDDVAHELLAEFLPSTALRLISSVASKIYGAISSRIFSHEVGEVYGESRALLFKQKDQGREATVNSQQPSHCHTSSAN